MAKAKKKTAKKEAKPKTKPKPAAETAVPMPEAAAPDQALVDIAEHAKRPVGALDMGIEAVDLVGIGIAELFRPRRPGERGQGHEAEDQNRHSADRFQAYLHGRQNMGPFGFGQGCRAN